MISIVVADDQELLRESLKIIIDSNENCKVVGLAKDGEEAICLTQKLNPDLVLLDIRMPKINGIECTKIIKEYNSTIKVLILTTFDDDEYIYDSLRYGADGFLLKGISRDELINSIITVYNGGSTMDPQTAKKAINLFRKMTNIFPGPSNLENAEGDSGLTELELRIIQLIGKGFSNKEIGSTCCLSEGTVRNYISNILKKLDLRNRTQIAIFAIQSGIMIHNYGN
jgi:DNA-binding NarL/FixJ family response regulator